MDRSCRKAHCAALLQAIDLIDEAGSRVRLRHAQLPEEARDLDKELRALLKEKDAAVRGQVCFQPLLTVHWSRGASVRACLLTNNCSDRTSVLRACVPHMRP